MMEYGIGGGGGSGGSGGDHQHQQQDDASDHHQKGKKKYHRHTAHQIQRLEAMFKECPHPDEKTRLQLSRELGLAPRQIKFWFQNRRTQIKAQHERADNCGLRAENDRIRCENIAIREALKNIICPSCGGPPVGEDSYFDEQKLRMENAQLKEQLDRVSSIAAKYIGRPISQLPPVQPIHISSLDLSMSSFVGGHGHGGGATSSLDLDLLPGSSSSNFIPNLPFLHAVASSSTAAGGGMISDMDKSLMSEIAANAMNDLIKILQTNDPLWMDIKPAAGVVRGDRDNDGRLISRPNSFFNNPNIVHVEASRHSGVVIMNALALVDMFMDANKWVELFPTIVSTAKTIEVLSSGLLGSQSGTLQLMYEELQVLSPFVPNRQIYFIRFCQQIEQGSWVIVDVSYDILHHQNQLENLSCQSPAAAAACKVFKYPSGCWIQDMPNGYSKVTWVEHMEVEERIEVHRLFKEVIHSGMGFGAERWVASLERMCERMACMMAVTSMNSTSPHDQLGGVIPSPEGKRSMRKLAQRMVSSFCTSIINNNNNNNNNNAAGAASSSINNSGGHQWTTLNNNNINNNNNKGSTTIASCTSINDELEVRATIHKTTDPGQPNGVVLSAATTIWLPFSPLSLFNFFRDERTRHQWDVLSNQNPFQEVAHIANGSHPGNCISLLRALNTSQNNMLVLQESCIDSWGALVVYCPVDLPAINIAMSGEDPTYIPLLPSGFTITPDGRRRTTTCGQDAETTTTTTGGGGSLLTVVLQILVSSMRPTAAKMSQESVNTVNNLISNTVHQIKAALNCSTTSST